MLEPVVARCRHHMKRHYFLGENCNCAVVCPCLVSPAAPMTVRPSQGVYDVALFFHIDQGSYDQTPLNSLGISSASSMQASHRYPDALSLAPAREFRGIVQQHRERTPRTSKLWFIPLMEERVCPFRRTVL